MNCKILWQIMCFEQTSKTHKKKLHIKTLARAGIRTRKLSQPSRMRYLWTTDCRLF